MAKIKAGDAEDKAALLEAFRLFLDEAWQADVSAKPDPSEADERPIDLYSLFSELTVLKNEVRLEARQFRQALEQFQSFMHNFEHYQEGLPAGFDALAQRHSDHLLRDFLLQLLDLRDRMAAGMRFAQNYEPVWLTGWRDRKTMRAIQAGQTLTLKRLDQVLASRSVLPMQVVGCLFDPGTMHAVEMDSRSRIAEGMVTAELRQGFTWKGQPLRMAEVRVNKLESA